MLFSTSLVALILSPRRLQIKNTKRDLIICELTFPNAVLSVRLNRKRLVVVLEDQIYLYDIQTMKLLYTIETSPNPAAICALSPSQDNCYLAYPVPAKGTPVSSAPAHAPPNSVHVPQTTGQVLLFDAVQLKVTNLVDAHRSPLSCITFNNEGTVMATASDKGTIIRVFSVPDAHKLYQFRRGSMPSRIYSMAFNITSTLLCVSSATETIHIFKLGPQSPRMTDDGEEPVSPTRGTSISSRRLSAGSDTLVDQPANDEDGSESPTLANRKPNGTFMGLLRRTSQHVGINLASTVGGYLPKGVAEMWEPSRDFAWIRLPRTSSGVPPGQLRSVVAMSANSPQVMVVTNEGNFYVFSIDLAKGGEGTLTKQYS
jgi:autophagy-related protein 18